ncbi:uncharacterized protein [Macrobrachium rosenbergii]|uniref:uncharacterized protein n=1 Tax=Macrobrachium rosenbergii TaxID=79674 RepID=UPI0034D56DCB
MRGTRQEELKVHIESEVEKKEKSDAEIQKTNVVCFKCGRAGHYSRDCYQTQQSKPVGQVVKGDQVKQTMTRSVGKIETVGKTETKQTECLETSGNLSSSMTDKPLRISPTVDLEKNNLHLLKSCVTTRSMKRTPSASEETEDLPAQKGLSEGSLSLEVLFQESEVSPSANNERISQEEESVVIEETQSSQSVPEETKTETVSVTQTSSTEDEDGYKLGAESKLNNSSILENLEDKLKHLSVEQSGELSEVIQSFPESFADVPRRTNLTKHDMKIREDGKPCKQRAYRFSPFHRDVLKKEVEYLLHHG